MASKTGKVEKLPGSKIKAGTDKKLDLKEKGAKESESDNLGKQGKSKDGFRNKAMEHKR